MQPLRAAVWGGLTGRGAWGLDLVQVGMRVVGLEHRLLHHTDAVAMHDLLQHVEDLLGPGALEGEDPCG